MCWNVWSILNERKLDNFLQIIEDKDISIACVTETWFDSKNGVFSQAIKKRGYELHHAYREDKRGGGTAILYKKQLMVKEGDASSSEYSSFEYVFVTLTLQSKKRVILICLYRKQEISFNLFYDEFTNFMDKILNKGEVMLLVGDFNVWVDCEEDTEAEKLLTLMSAYGLTQVVQDATQREGHTLDHIYVNEFQLLMEHVVLDETLGLNTDHFPLVISIPAPNNENETNYTSFRKLKDIDTEKFNDDLRNAFNAIDFSDLSFQEMYEKYDEASRSVVDCHAPMQTRKQKPTEAGWMDTEYKKCRAERRKLERKWRKNRTEENRNNWIHQKELCAQLSLSKQTHHYTQLVEGASNSMKSLFKVANELLDKNSKKVLPTHDDPKVLADRFNHFFVDKVKKIRQSIPEVTAYPAYYSRPFIGEKLTIFRPTTKEELQKLISKNGVKTCMEDPIPSRLFSSASDIILPVLMKLVNQSLKEGSMEGINWSVLDPLMKKIGLDPEVDKNYRPVNNLLYMSKLTERVVSTRMDEHMDKHCLHENSQFGYKTHHNTETMLLSLTDEALRGFDDNKATIIIFLDLSAAFDTIDIDKLLQILEDEIGISGTALKWFRSFLTGRTQRVKISGKYSESLEVPCGAPQGSVLGPKLFNINVRSQPLAFQHCRFKSSSFADDSNGRRTFALTFQFNVLTSEVIKCMDEIVQWSNLHFMKINPDKTELLLLRPASLNKEVIINGILYQGQCIRFSSEVKNVGVWIDENLTMDKHINSLVSHCYKILRDISRIKKYIHRLHLELLVHAVVTSRLDYCNCLFVNINRSNLFKMQKVQNSAGRLILGRRRRDSAKEILKELHWLNIEARITFKILLLVFKVIKGMCNMSLKYKSFNGRPDDYLLLETPNFKTSYGKRLFEYNGSRWWNALPVNIRMMEDIEEYKKSIKTILFADFDNLKRTAFRYQ